MKKWTAYLGIAVTALVLSACGGGGDAGEVKATYKITNDTKERAYSAFLASLDGLDDMSHLEEAFALLDENNSCIKKESENKAEFNNCRYHTTYVDINISGAMEFTEPYTYKLVDYHVENNEDGSSLTIDSGIISLEKNVSYYAVEKFIDVTAVMLDGKEHKMEIKNLHWYDNYDNNGTLVIRGFASASFIGNKWIEFKTSDDCDPDEGKGWFKIIGSEQTSLQLSFVGSESVLILLNEYELKLYEKFEDFEEDYDKRDEYLKE